MRGSIKLKRWLPFRATQVIAPGVGFIWRARVACLISGYDQHGHETVDGITIPTRGSVGWHYGEPGWTAGEFFRFHLTDIDPVH